jgi:hypothetical protein
VDVPEGMLLLFHGLEGLERMVAALRAGEPCPPAEPSLLDELAGKATDRGGPKKA